MTSEFEGLKHDLSAQNQYSELESSTPDSFELLSAYIDGELSPSERKQVQTWLDADPQFKQLYIQLLNLQGQIQNFVVPQNETHKEITTKVFQSIDRSHRQKRRLVLGGSAIVASAIAAFYGIFGSFSPFSARMAKMNLLESSNSVTLAVAVDQPAIDIPKSITGYSQHNLKQ